MIPFVRSLPLIAVLASASVARGQSELLLFEDFENGLGVWTVVNGATGLWRVAANTTCEAESAMAAYNRPATCNYNTGSPNNGEIISPPVTLSGQSPFPIYFSSKREMDVAADTACFRFRVVGDPTWTNLYCAFDNSGTLHPAILEVPAGHDGETVEFSFRVTANNLGNNELGWLFDDFEVRNSGPALPAMIADVSPPFGPNTGATDIVITGTNFTGTSQVMFGDTPAVYNVNTNNNITVDVPANAQLGYVDVSVTNFWGTVTARDAFDFFVPPTTIGTPCDTAFLSWSGSPTLGQQYRVTTEGLGLNNQFLLVEWSNEVAPQPFRRRLAQTGGAAECLIHVVPTATLALGGTDTHVFMIPNDVGLIGTRLRTQALIRPIGGGRMSATQALDVVIGE